MSNNILIAYTTASDPWRKPKDAADWVFDKENGPAQTVTVALALKPDKIYLLYTHGDEKSSTKANFEKTKAFLEGHLKKVTIEGIEIGIEDITDYNELTQKLPIILEKIKLENSGNFYLVSGFPQARYIFILCLTAKVLNGELLEVPAIKPWPKKVNDRKEYGKRLRKTDISIFTRFQEIYRDRVNAYRIRINVDKGTIKIGNEPWQLRTGEACSYFRFLTVLAALKLYGDEPFMPKEIQRKIYRQNIEINVWRAKTTINKKVGDITDKSVLPIKELVVKTEKGLTISDSLKPVEFMIKIEGNMRELLNVYFTPSEISSYFPFLPDKY